MNGFLSSTHSVTVVFSFTKDNKQLNFFFFLSFLWFYSKIRKLSVSIIAWASYYKVNYQKLFDTESRFVVYFIETGTKKMFYYIWLLSQWLTWLTLNEAYANSNRGNKNSKEWAWIYIITHILSHPGINDEFIYLFLFWCYGD